MEEKSSYLDLYEAISKVQRMTIDGSVVQKEYLREMLSMKVTEIMAIAMMDEAFSQRGE